MIYLDTHVVAGYTVPPNYDSMVAKLIVHGPTREAAIERMQVALSEMIVDGIRTNIPLQRRIMQDKVFRAGQHHIDLDLAQVRTWQSTLRSMGSTGLESVKLERATLRWAGQQWEGLSGEAKLDAVGVTSVALRNDTGSLQWLSERRGEGWGFELGVKPFKLPGAGVELAKRQMASRQ